MKLGIDLNVVRSGNYIIIDKEKYQKIMKLIEEKSPKTYEKLFKNLVISDLLVVDNS